MKTSILCKLVLIAGMTGLAAQAHAATRIWSFPVDGDFSDTTKWNNGAVPGALDVAAFTGTTAYPSGSAFTVTLTASATNQYMRVDGDGPFSMTMNLNGRNYVATDSGGSTTTTTVIARGADDRNTLNITGTGTFRTNGFYVGAVATSSGTMSVSGTGTVLDVHTNEGVVGFGGTGRLEIKTGASFNSSSLVRVGRSTGSVGTLLVSSGTWTASNEAIFGSNASDSEGNMEIRNGGKVSFTGVGTNGQISFAQVAGSRASALITGSGSELNVNGAIGIGGRGTSAGGSANVSVTDGGLMSTNSTLRVFASGTLSIDDGSVSAVNLGASGSEVSGRIALTLSGSNALIDVSNDVFLNASTSVLTLSLDGSASYAANDVIRLINYGTLTGSFSNYTQGQQFTLGDYEFVFGYAEGSGGDHFIGLTVVPEPAAIWLLTAAGSLFILLKRNARRRV